MTRARERSHAGADLRLQTFTASSGDQLLLSSLNERDGASAFVSVEDTDDCELPTAELTVPELFRLARTLRQMGREIVLRRRVHQWTTRP